MFMEKIIGLIDAPFTPFYANGDVNLDVEPGCQVTKLGHLYFAGYSYEFPNQWETALYYDFSNVPLTAGYDGPFYDLPDNTLIFLNAASEAVCPYREQMTPIGNSRRPYNWQDEKYRNTVRGGAAVIVCYRRGMLREPAQLHSRESQLRPCIL